MNGFWIFEFRSAFSILTTKTPGPAREELSLIPGPDQLGRPGNNVIFSDVLDRVRAHN